MASAAGGIATAAGGIATAARGAVSAAGGVVSAAGTAGTTGQVVRKRGKPLGSVVCRCFAAKATIDAESEKLLSPRSCTLFSSAEPLRSFF
ncbi:hypothetical protein N9276_01900 [Rhodopirellula sp.]|nr:hypothetical protein [Rhodopirellula sp.]